jgi:hypothetical protein
MPCCIKGLVRRELVCVGVSWDKAEVEVGCVGVSWDKAEVEVGCSCTAHSEAQ